jgi:hypothetical protein
MFSFTVYKQSVSALLGVSCWLFEGRCAQSVPIATELRSNGRCVSFPMFLEGV